jgi:hypothetical protein
MLNHDSTPRIVFSVSARLQLARDFRIMQALARACEHFAGNLPKEPETEELLYGVATQWERIRERLLRMSDMES